MMKKSFWYNSDQNGDLLKPRTGHGQYVVDIDNMLFAISGLSNCTVSTYRVFLQCTMCTLFSLMPLYLLRPCIRYQGGRSCAGERVAPAEKFGLGRTKILSPNIRYFVANEDLSRLAKIFIAIFAPDERLPSSSTLSDTIRRRGDTGAYLGKQGRIQGHILGKSRI